MPKAKTTKTPCQMDGCDRDAVHKGSQLCHRCYQFVYYWQGKSVTQLMKRRSTIKFWEQRMDSYAAERANVAPLKRAK